MATVDELVKQYETDEKLQKEVADIHAFRKKAQRESLIGRSAQVH